MSESVLKKQEFYHWAFGKMRIVSSKMNANHELLLNFEVLEPQGIPKRFRKNVDLETLRSFKLDSVGREVFVSLEDVYDVLKKSSKDSSHTIFKMEKVKKLKTSKVKRNYNKVRNEIAKLWADEEGLEYHSNRLKRNTEYRVKRNTKGEGQKDLLKLYQKEYLPRFSENDLKLCKLEDFRAIDYRTLEGALFYSYWYTFRYALDAYKLCDIVLKDEDIKSIIIIGAGNNLVASRSLCKWTQLNMY